MGKKQKDQVEEVEEVEEVSDEGKDGKREKESVEKRKKAKRKDAIERWSGIIFMAVVLLIGLILWVGSEVGQPSNEWLEPDLPVGGRGDYPVSPQTPRVIVE